MRPIIGQNPEAVLGQTLTNEQKILWNYIFNTFHPTIIDPVFYQGVTAGSEFTVYAATKLYIAYSVEISSNGSIEPVTHISFYDHTNSIFYRVGDNSITYNTTALSYAYLASQAITENLFFSRLTISNGLYLKFNGYRITY